MGGIRTHHLQPATFVSFSPDHAEVQEIQEKVANLLQPLDSALVTVAELSEVDGAKSPLADHVTSLTERNIVKRIGHAAQQVVAVLLDCGFNVFTKGSEIPGL